MFLAAPYPPTNPRKRGPVNCATNRALRRWVWHMAACVILLAWTVEANQPKDYERKAVFLFNFAKFVDWPEAPSPNTNAIVIGIFGDDAVGEVLPALVKGHMVKGRPIEIRKYRARDELWTCHILFISRSEAKQSTKVLQNIARRPVLTVGDQENFLSQGGMIDFVMEDQTVRFDINLRNADKAGLKLSSKLLSVARSVQKKS